LRAGIRRGFRLARVLGIPISIDYSWFLVFALFVWMLGGVAFPAAYPGVPPLHLWAAGLAAALLFFGSVLAHELSHSLVARALGLRVMGITLFVFGGVSTLAEEPEDGWAEIKIAAAGPLLSFCLGATFWVIAGFVSTTGWGPPLAAEVLGYLALANGILGLFNLVPGFPLDGGRVLRAIWWIGSGSFVRATRVATAVGSAVALLLIGLGFVRAILGDLGGLWLVLIGLFLRSAASAARRESDLRTLLAGATVGDVMTPDPARIPAGVTLQEAATEYFQRFGLDGFPVIRNGHVCGLVTLRDLHAVRGPERAEWTVEQAMTPMEDLSTAGPGEAVRTLMERLAREGREASLVMEGSRLVGLVSLRGLGRYLELRRMDIEPPGAG
jgi:Zn-dependent protease